MKRLFTTFAAITAVLISGLAQASGEMRELMSHLKDAWFYYAIWLVIAGGFWLYHKGKDDGKKEERER